MILVRINGGATNRTQKQNKTKQNEKESCSNSMKIIRNTTI